jgi:hypothetical protein
MCRCAAASCCNSRIDRARARATKPDDVIAAKCIFNVIRPADVHHSTVSQVRQAQFQRRPTSNADTSLGLSITQRCSLPQRSPRFGTPRYKLETEPTCPARFQFGPFPPRRGRQNWQTGHAGKIVNMTFSCWRGHLTVPHRGATEIDHYRDLVPARQPGQQAHGLSHSRPFSRQDRD